MDRKAVQVRPEQSGAAPAGARQRAQEPRPSEVGLRWRFALALSDAAARRRAERRS